MDIGGFKDYLANGEMNVVGFRIPQLPAATQDEGDVVSNAAVAKTFLKKTLTEHDKAYHPNGFDPKKDKCNFRSMLQKNDNVDALVEEKPKKDAQLGLVEFVEGDDGKKKVVDIVEVDEAKEEIEGIAEDSIDKYLSIAGE